MRISKKATKNRDSGHDRNINTRGDFLERK